jgi:hypothetical protein
MLDNEHRVTVHTTRFTSTNNGHGHESQCQSSKGEISGKPYKADLSAKL